MNDRLPMRALVVHESMFGNTECIARAVADGLRAEGADVQIVDVAAAPEELPSDLDLLVVGAPTHAFSLSRAGTRSDAVRQGAPPARACTGLRDWLTELRINGPLPPVAVFDTRASKVRRLPMAAGPAAARLGRRRGFALAAEPAAFLVQDIRGPLVDGETQKATAWGTHLAGLGRIHRAVTAGRRPPL